MILLQFSVNDVLICLIILYFRERDLHDERDALHQQHQETDQHYNGLVKSLKDRVCH